MTQEDAEILYKLEKLFTEMFDRMDNLQAELRSLESDFVEYLTENPRLDEQWAEERLRKLEDEMRQLIKNSKDV